MITISVRIVVGAGNEKLIKQLSGFLTQNGYHVVAEADNGNELLRQTSAIYPDICIFDSQLKGLQGAHLAELIMSKSNSPLIVFVTPLELANYYRLNQEANFMTIAKPINKDLLINTIELLVKTNRSLKKVQKEIESIKHNINKDDVVQKAKKLLMDNVGLTEEEAHRKIQKQSMDKGISKIKMAQIIIDMYN